MTLSYSPKECLAILALCLLPAILQPVLIATTGYNDTSTLTNMAVGVPYILCAVFFVMFVYCLWNAMEFDYW